MTRSGMEGTVLGTLIMPYCSGIGNLVFAFVVGQQGGAGAEVMTNAIVNNVTNLTLLIGLPAAIWGLKLSPATKTKRAKRGNPSESRMNKLSMLLTLSAVFAFTGAVWALARDGKLDFNDGLVLAGLFLFWQLFHVFEVLKGSARQHRAWNWKLPINLALLGVGAYATYVSIDWLVSWLSQVRTGGFVSAKNLGWLSGWLMVLPNAMLALYYGWRGNPEIVYTSQVGDGHICIPLCVGVFAMHQTFSLPSMFETGVLMLFGATIAHVLLVALFNGVSRFAGWVLMAVYGMFLYKGFV